MLVKRAPGPSLQKQWKGHYSKRHSSLFIMCWISMPSSYGEWDGSPNSADLWILGTLMWTWKHCILWIADQKSAVVGHLLNSWRDVDHRSPVGDDVGTPGLGWWQPSGSCMITHHFLVPEKDFDAHPSFGVELGLVDFLLCVGGLGSSVLTVRKMWS